jgi:hypothetical protein
MYDGLWHIINVAPVDSSGALGASDPRRISQAHINQGRIQDFKLGGGGAFKKIAPSGGRREIFLGISCENSRFYAKKADYRISLLPLTSNLKWNRGEQTTLYVKFVV